MLNNIKIGLLSLLVPMAHAMPATFTFQNKPINPACVAMFNNSEADYPYVKAINLSVCQNSNAASYDPLVKDDWIYFYNNNKNVNDGSYYYKVIGATSDDTFVIQTKSNGGGTLTSGMVLFIRLQEQPFFVFDDNNLTSNHIIEMRLIGYLLGGDRCVGDFKTLYLQNDILEITQYNGENASDCSKTKTFTLDLSKI